MKKTNLLIAVSFILSSVVSAQSKQPGSKTSKQSGADILHQWNKTITTAMVSDGFHPKLASRTYTYPNIAAYEVLVNFHPDYRSLQGQLNGLDSLPMIEATKKYDKKICVAQAFSDVAKKLIYRPDRCDELLASQIKMLTEQKHLDEETVANSTDFGKKVAERILVWVKKDSYNKTKAQPRYIFSNEPGKWKPTPPEYRSACEPYWSILRTWAIKNVNDYISPPTVPFSTDTNSQFYKNAKEVYLFSKNITPEQKAIAIFWDDNPDLMTFTGHFPKPRRQMSPAAHWNGIAAIACKMKNKNLMETAAVYALISVAMADGFIVSFTEKYESNLVRPITYIRDNIDPEWNCLLVTPPFPEHTSGHSVISAAAATVLTKIFGDNFNYSDNSEEEYGLQPRAFKSFLQAADEVSISRFYGGIHYKTGIYAGMEQGKKIGKYINEEIKTRK